MAKMVRTLGAVAVVAALGVGYYSGTAGWFDVLNKKQQVNGHEYVMDSALFERSFTDIAELSTEQYNYTDIYQYNDGGRGLLRWTLPGTRNTFLVSYDGTVKAGIKDVSQVEVSVDNANREIIVDIPAAEITHSDVDEKSAKVWDQKVSRFTPMGVRTVLDAINGQEEAARKQAIDDGLLRRADERAETVVTAQVQAVLDGLGDDGKGWKVKVE